MKAPLLLSLGVIIFFSSASIPSTLVAERAMSRAKMEKELQNLRDTLHEAHCEIAKKSDRIAELEAMVKQEKVSGGEMPSKPAAEKATLRAKPKKKKSEAVMPAAAKASSREGSKSQECESDCKGSESYAAIKIRYDQNSAVNYEGRDKVLSFVEKELEKNPVTLFSVLASANDSAFETKDLDIASNRARFLVDYLVIRGISDDVFVRVEGSASSKDGPEGRSALVLVESK